MSIELSIVIPVYGVEKYILEFAESLFPQLNNKVEIIIVNDGTNDDSIDILKNYIRKIGFLSENITWLEQVNQGQSVARNNGIVKASGKYVTFLDPDDTVAENYIYEILEAIKLSPDIVHFNAEVFSSLEGGKNKINEIKLADDDFLFDFEKKNILETYSKRAWFSWLRVLKKEFLNKNFFPVNVNYQDMMAFPKVYKKVKLAKNINRNLVSYRVHNESSVNVFKPKLINSADFGIKLYEKVEDDFDLIIYKQFLDLRTNLTMNSQGMNAALKWYYSQVYNDHNSYYYKRKFTLIFISLKIIGLFSYRKLKNSLMIRGD